MSVPPEIIGHVPADAELFDELLSFVVARFKEKVKKAEANKDTAAKRRAESAIKTILLFATTVKQRPWGLAEGIEWLRKRAQPFAGHPDYRPEWRPDET